jgi:hypothetical protein
MIAFLASDRADGPGPDHCYGDDVITRLPSTVRSLCQLDAERRRQAPSPRLQTQRVCHLNFVRAVNAHPSQPSPADEPPRLAIAQAVDPQAVPLPVLHVELDIAFCFHAVANPPSVAMTTPSACIAHRSSRSSSEVG